MGKLKITITHVEGLKMIDSNVNPGKISFLIFFRSIRYTLCKCWKNEEIFSNKNNKEELKSCLE